MPRPNLLFIYTDQQAYNTLAAYGNDRIQVPNLNRLADESVVVEQAYVTQPVCTLSRSSIPTGLYPHSTGCAKNNVPLPAETLCLPEMVRDGEYVTAHHGKWHLGDEIFAQHGFGEWRAVKDSYAPFYSAARDRGVRSSHHRFLMEHGFTPRNGEVFGNVEVARLPEEFSRPAFLAREASRFIRENRSRPFILYVGFVEPHEPYVSQRDGQHAPRSVALPANFARPPTEEQPLKARATYSTLREAGYRVAAETHMPLRTDDDWRRIIAAYWGLCSLVDTHAGTILNTLDECGLRGRTVVVFTSDHGDMAGSHQLLAKTVMFEESVRVPLLIRLPRQRRGWRLGGPVSQIDLVPTLLDLLGEKVPGRLQGKSLKPLLESPGSRHDEDVFIEWNGPNTDFLGLETGPHTVPETMAAEITAERLQACITDPVRSIVTADGWKLNSSTVGEHELYDFNDDPGETTNLASRREHRSKMSGLQDRIRRWQERMVDSSDAARAP